MKPFQFFERGKTSVPFVTLNLFDKKVYIPEPESVSYLANTSALFSVQYTKDKVCILFETANRVKLSACCHFMLHSNYPPLDSYKCRFFHEKHNTAHRDATIAEFRSPELNTVMTSVDGLKSLEQ